MIRSSKINITFAVVLGVVATLGMASYVNTRRLIDTNARVIHTHRVLEDLGIILSTLQDAETGQRGFIITGQDRYLEPYDQARIRLDNQLAALAGLTEDNPDQRAALHRLKALTDSKLDELKQTIELRRQSGPEAVMPVILSGRGRIPLI